MAKRTRRAPAPAKGYADRYPGAKPLHGGEEFFTWENVGQELVGDFVEVKPFKNGHIARIRTEEGIIPFSAPTILAGILKAVKPGTPIAVVFSGEKDTGRKGQSPIKQFEVYELDEEEEGGTE